MQLTDLGVGTPCPSLNVQFTPGFRYIVLLDEGTLSLWLKAHLVPVYIFICPKLKKECHWLKIHFSPGEGTVYPCLNVQFASG